LHYKPVEKVAQEVVGKGWMQTLLHSKTLLHLNLPHDLQVALTNDLNKYYS